MTEWNDTVFRVTRSTGKSPVVIVCEHASSYIPVVFKGLGLSQDLRKSHIAWDPGALDVARALSEKLDAPLISGEISRLVYDCNRPPEAHDAVPARSEVFDVPGNAGLTAAALRDRADHVYHPFHNALEGLIRDRTGSVVLVTVHSFTPVFKGIQREVELGILCDSDTRLADAMIGTAETHTDHVIGRNEPYGPEDGVTHTLKRHAVPLGLLNVMLEIRNDLLPDMRSSREMAGMLAVWLSDAIETCNFAREAG